MRKNLIDNFLEWMLFIIFLALIFGSFAVVIFQVYYFLRNGQWVPIAVTDLLDFSQIQNKWIGLYSILEWFPASIGLFLISLLVIFCIPKFKVN